MSQPERGLDQPTTLASDTEIADRPRCRPGRIDRRPATLSPRSVPVRHDACAPEPLPAQEWSKPMGLGITDPRPSLETSREPSRLPLRSWCGVQAEQQAWGCVSRIGTMAFRSR